MVPSPDGGWSVRIAGAERASKRFSTQQQAITWAREASSSAKGELVIHGRDGTIREKDSYGQGSLPTRGKR